MDLTLRFFATGFGGEARLAGCLDAGFGDEAFGVFTRGFGLTATAEGERVWRRAVLACVVGGGPAMVRLMSQCAIVEGRGGRRKRFAWSSEV